MRFRTFFLLLLEVSIPEKFFILQPQLLLSVSGVFPQFPAIVSATKALLGYW